MPRVSFDYDETLSTPEAQKLATILISNNIEVIVVTARSPDEEDDRRIPDWNNDDLFEITDALTIPRENIVFRNHRRKYRYFQEHPDIVWHLDDSYGDVVEINLHTKVVGISVLEFGWFSTCLELVGIPYQPEYNSNYNE